MEDLQLRNPNFPFFLFFSFSIKLIIALLIFFSTLYPGIPPFQWTMLFVNLAIVIYFIDAFYAQKLYPKLGLRLNLAILTIFIVICLFTYIYLFSQYYELTFTRIGIYTPLDLVIGALPFLLIMEISRRAHPVLFLINVFLSFYAFFGFIFPRPFYHPGISVVRYIVANTIEFANGIYGFYPTIAFHLIGPPLLLFGFLSGFKVVDSFLRITLAKFGLKRLLVPYLSVITSSILGTMSGSVTANVSATGSFTIPTMKRMGLSPVDAGAIETSASLGALIIPPILGIAGFIMAEILGVPYVEIALASVNIAVLYVASVLIGVTFVALTQLRSSQHIGSSKEEISLPKPEPFDYINIFTLFAAFGSLMYYLFFELLSIAMAAIQAILITLGFRIIAHIAFCYLKRREFGLRDLASQLTNGIKSGIETFSYVTLLLAVLGIMVAMFTVTGFATNLGIVLLGATKAEFTIPVAIAFIFGIFLGLGLPPTATYVILASIFVPYMIPFGISALQAHFFAFINGVIAEYSPPASVAAAVAAGISGGSFTRIMLKGLEIAFPIFIIQFAVLIYPELLTLSLEGLIRALILFGSGCGITIAFLYRPRDARLTDHVIRCLAPILGFILFYPFPEVTKIPAILILLTFLLLCIKRLLK